MLVSGFGTRLGDMPAKPTEFVTPAHGPDWVLVLDDPSAGYAPPGLP